MRDLAVAARDRECQIIVSTHSPYVLEELPLSARVYILEAGGGKEIVNGVSPQFAMTKMDDEQHPDCELYVEDPRAATWLNEILSRHAREIFVRCSIVPYGAANLGSPSGRWFMLIDSDGQRASFLTEIKGQRWGASCSPAEMLLSV